MEAIDSSEGSWAYARRFLVYRLRRSDPGTSILLHTFGNTPWRWARAIMASLPRLGSGD
jgi:hypothetical protein